MSQNTVRAYENDLVHFAGWYRETVGEEPRPELITGLDLSEYRQHLMQKHKPATVNRRLSALKRWLGWALDRGIIDRLPGIPKQVKQERLAPKSLSRNEVNALLRAVERGGNLRDIAIVNVFLHCGLRVSELANLKVEDLELGERSGKITVWGKGNKFREVPVKAPARKALKDYLEVRPEGERLFMGQRGPLTVRGVQNVLAKYAYQARIALSPHTLRHTCARNLLDAGVNLVDVAAMLGHENLSTTQVYTRPTFEQLKRAVEGK